MNSSDGSMSACCTEYNSLNLRRPSRPCCVANRELNVGCQARPTALRMPLAYLLPSACVCPVFDVENFQIVARNEASAHGSDPPQTFVSEPMPTYRLPAPSSARLRLTWPSSGMPKTISSGLPS